MMKEWLLPIVSAALGSLSFAMFFGVRSRKLWFSLLGGALNWGLVGIFQFDLVAAIFGGMSGVVSRIIYTLVGLAGIWGITMLFRKRSRPAFMQDDGDA